MLTIGDIVPQFSLLDDQGNLVTNEDLRGSWTILYFYPKDDTPGCTAEACSFRDLLPRFDGVQAKVYGVSTDSVASHKKFKEKYNLTFPLLSDPDHVLHELFGVWKEKNLFGRMGMGTERTTFIIDPDLTIRKIFAKVHPEGHAEEVRRALETYTT